MRIPTLRKPRYSLVKRAVQFVLRELGHPEPPIPIEEFASKMGWDTVYQELPEVDGCMLRMEYRKVTTFFLLISTRVDPNSPYNEETILRRRSFTLAHEIGHILLHSSFIVDSRDMSFLSDETAKVIEQEADWFASRLLMPNYVFKDVIDLLPDQLADKCRVNVTAAKIRIKNLPGSIQEPLINSAGLSSWPPYDDYYIPDAPTHQIIDSWAAFEETAATKPSTAIKSPIHTDVPPSPREVKTEAITNRLIYIPSKKRYEELGKYNDDMIDMWRRKFGFE